MSVRPLLTSLPLAFFAASIAVGSIAMASEPSDQPNIVLIVADDLGYSDLGCYGGEIDTPNLDRLAEGGLRFTRFCNAGMCVTSRSSLMTGQWWPTAQRNFAESTTMPERLQATGYRTGLIGKWHLQGHPMDHGFDHFFGFLNGFADHFTGNQDYQLNRQPFRDFSPQYYSSDAFTDRAIQFVNASDHAKPFMLMLSYQAPHNPLQAPDDEIAKYRGRYLKGWQTIREARFEKQKQIGIVSKDEILPDYPRNLPTWNKLSAAQRDLEDLRMAVYAAMVDRMDQGIGRLMAAIDAKGVSNNTLVLFMSDNGTDSFSVADRGMLARGILPGDPASNYQPGTGWAYASVTPWRLYKISQHAGGVTSGAILSWPAKVKEPGGIRSQSIHLVDVLPTVMELVGQPANQQQRDQQKEFAGQSFATLIDRSNWKRSQPLFFQYMDNRAIRTSRWSLAEVDGSGWELFDAKQDRLETNDVSANHPGVVNRLSEEWLTWWKDAMQTSSYRPTSTRTGPHYSPQGDRGSGRMYVPSSMPATLSKPR